MYLVSLDRSKIQMVDSCNMLNLPTIPKSLNTTFLGAIIQKETFQLACLISKHSGFDLDFYIPLLWPFCRFEMMLIGNLESPPGLLV